MRAPKGLVAWRDHRPGDGMKGVKGTILSIRPHASVTIETFSRPAHLADLKGAIGGASDDAYAVVATAKG
jgi:hypothetical protein